MPESAAIRAIDKVQSANGVWFQKAPQSIDASLITGLTSFAAARLAEDSAGALRTALGLVIGTHVQAQNAKLAQIAAASWQIGDLAQVVHLGAGVPGFARMAKGSAAQLLRMNDAGSAPAYADAPYIPIASRTDAAGLACIDLAIPADCGVLEIDLANFVPASGAAILGLRFRTAGQPSLVPAPRITHGPLTPREAMSTAPERSPSTCMG